jgi:hypothetical protein
VKTKERRKPERVKDKIVRQRGFKNIRLEGEEVAEFSYRPLACKKAYRMIVVRKNLAVEAGQQRLYDDYRYFFYLTNDWKSSPAEIVFQANDRCNQENLHAQLKGGVRALQAPLDTLDSNGAYMVMVALAWNMKAWFALWPQENSGRWQERHRQEKQTVLRMEFKTFVNAFMRMPCQLIRAGRRLIYRLANWNPWQGMFFRTLDQLHC